MIHDLENTIYEVSDTQIIDKDKINSLNNKLLRKSSYKYEKDLKVYEISEALAQKIIGRLSIAVWGIVTIMLNLAWNVLWATLINEKILIT